MRPFETSMLLLNIISLLALVVPANPQLLWLKFVPSLNIGFLILHFPVEHYRWQMLPTYLLAVGLFLLSLPTLLSPRKKPIRHQGLAIGITSVGILWWLVAAALPVALPVPVLPPPLGPNPIGTIIYDWTDTTRPEIYSLDNPNDKRELVAQIWYPAQGIPNTPPVPIIDNWGIAGPALAKFLKVPAFVLDHVPLVITHTYADAPLQDKGAPYPVIIFSHGYDSYRTAGFNQMEMLASMGYIVVAIDHPYGAAFTIFADGRSALNYPEVLPAESSPNYPQARETIAATFVADQRFVLDQLQLLNSGQIASPLTGKLDLQRIGVAGVSTGGGASVWTCQLDTRCKAGIALDGWYEPLPEGMITQPLRQPFMFMQSETKMWKFDNLSRLDKLFQGTRNESYHLKFNGLLHYDFGDYPLLTPLNGFLPQRGPLPGERAVQVVNAYLLTFFEKYLKGQNSPLLNSASPDYPEVEFKSRKP